jgi:hypothetical protein
MRVLLALTLIVLGAVAGFALTAWWLDQNGGGNVPRMEQRIALHAAAIDRRILKSGWSAPESWGVWSNGDRAELSIGLDGKPDGDVRIDLEAEGFVAPPRLDRQVVRVSVNGTSIGELNFDHRTALGTLIVPQNVIAQRNPIEIVFDIESPGAPAEYGLGSDPRKLGLALRLLTLSYPVAEIVQK